MAKTQNTSVTIRLHRYRYLAESKRDDQTLVDRLDKILANSEKQYRKRLARQKQKALTKDS